MTVAPNTITMTGLCLMIISYCIYWFYNPALETDFELPRWIFLFNGCAMLIYQTLDNMDGKQARKTGSSSPLGLLFDHGCDAVNSMFGSANWVIAMGLSPKTDPLSFWILVVGPMALFYVATWEEFYTGALILPIINGPSEGLAGGAMLSIATCFVGVSFWQTTSWFDSFFAPFVVPFLPSAMTALIPQAGFRNADIVIIASSAGFVQEMLIRSLSVVRKYGFATLFNMLPFLVMSLLTIMVGYVDQDVWFRTPRSSLWLVSGLFVEMVTQLMLDHITEEKFVPHRWTLIPLVLLTHMVATGEWEASRTTDDYLLVYATGIWSFLLFKMAIVISEICCVLSIWCFDIVTPRRKAVSTTYANGVSHVKNQ